MFSSTFKSFKFGDRVIARVGLWFDLDVGEHSSEAVEPNRNSFEPYGEAEIRSFALLLLVFKSSISGLIENWGKNFESGDERETGVKQFPSAIVALGKAMEDDGDDAGMVCS